MTERRHRGPVKPAMNASDQPRAILDAAISLLRDSQAGAGLLAVAVAAIGTAVHEGFRVRGETAALLWGRILSEPSARWATDAAETVGHLADESLVRNVVGAVAVDGVDKDLVRCALTALGGPACLSRLTDHDLAVLGRLPAWASNEVANVLVNVSEARAVDDGALADIATAWSQSPDARVRRASLENPRPAPSARR